MQREESPYSTACVLDMKNIADQNIEMNNRHQPFMDEGANSIMYQNDFACTQTLKNVSCYRTSFLSIYTFEETNI